MKVLIITAHYSPNVGGVETHLDDLTKSLIKRKHSVSVITYRPLTARVNWKIHEKKKNFEIFRIPWIPGLFYKLVPYPILSMLYLFPGLFALLPLMLIRNRPDVMHAHGLVAGAVGVFWGKIFGVRTVVSTHSVYSFPGSGAYTKFVQWIFDSADHISTLSKQALSEIRSLGNYDKKSSYFTYWIDLENFMPIKGAKKKLNWDKKFVVLFVGRLVEEKGISVLLDSFKTWNKNITLVIAGDGPLKNDVVKISKSSDNLIYLGRLSQKELPKYYSAADLFIVPSTSEEGFGRVIIESLACGTPVIGSDRGAIPEAMDNSVGDLIKVSKSSIKNSVELYLNDKKKLAEKTKKASPLARKRYSEKNVEKIIETYKE